MPMSSDSSHTSSAKRAAPFGILHPPRATFATSVYPYCSLDAWWTTERTYSTYCLRTSVYMSGELYPFPLHIKLL